ncbi:MAG: hypothetical protein U9P72_10235 [Campylobacterota bacterium]|nr:hypothetical protein [Campylobacterota bacterium]
MRYFLIIFLFLSSLESFEGDISLHHEQLDMNKKNSIESLYTKLKHENIPTDFGINYNISLIGTTPISTKNQFYDFVEPRAIIGSASIDYYEKQTAISVGRNSLNLPLLNGNFDGLVYYQMLNKFRWRFFYFVSYEILLPTFYTKDDSMDLKGVNLSYENKYFEIKTTAIDNRAENIYHTNLALKYNYYAISLEVAHYNSDNFLTENIQKLSISRYKESLFLEFGIIKNGENPIDKLLKFEQDELNSFGLGNKIYMPNAQNNYMEIAYGKENYYLNLLLGYTTYQKNSKARELDIGFEYKFSKEFSINLHLLRELSSQGDTTLFSSSLNYGFEL